MCGYEEERAYPVVGLEKLQRGSSMEFGLQAGEATLRNARARVWDWILWAVRT